MAALSLQEKLEKGYEVWVRNMTAKPPAMVCINFSYQGTKTLVKVPPGKYPFRLYPGTVSKDTIANGGSQLQHFISSGALRLISKKKAKAMLEDPDIKEESEALFFRANNDAAAQKWAQDIKRMAEGTIPAEDRDENDDGYVYGPPDLPPGMKLNQSAREQLESKLGMGDGAPSKARFQLAQSSADPNVQGRVVGIMTAWSNETDDGVLRQLKMMTSQLKAPDLHYVMRASKRNCRTYKWASDVLDRR